MIKLIDMTIDMAQVTYLKQIKISGMILLVFLSFDQNWVIASCHGYWQILHRETELFIEIFEGECSKNDFSAYR